MEGAFFAAPQLALGVLTLAFLLTLLECVWRKRWRWAQMVRILWILGLGFLIADWQRILSQQWSEPKPLNVFIDYSNSITLSSDRKQNVLTFLTELKDWAKSKNQSIDTHFFSESLR